MVVTNYSAYLHLVNMNIDLLMVTQIRNFSHFCANNLLLL